MRARSTTLVGLAALICAACDRPAPAPGEAPLVIASWNMNWLHREDGRGPIARDERDYAALRRYARDLDADVIALQEVDGAEAIGRIFDPSVYRAHVSSRDNAQRVAIVYKHALRVTRHPDLVSLARVHSERLRYGVDLSIHRHDRSVRILAVHLKSGCFSSPIEGAGAGAIAPGDDARACRVLASQMPPLTRWMRQRVEDNEAFVIAGDMNRRLHRTEQMWRRLSGSAPGLDAPTLSRRSWCWEGSYPQFIDHLLTDARAHARGPPFLSPVALLGARSRAPRHAPVRSLPHQRRTLHVTYESLV